MKKILATLVLSLFLLSSLATAHPGRTDANGGHYNRKTGEYHYHNGGKGSGSGNTGGSGQRQNKDVVDIKRVQERLNELGYDCGTPDGIKGPRTIEAIKSFQRSKGLEPDGIVGPKTKEALGL